MTPIHATIIGVFCVLTAASALLFIIQRKWPEKNLSELISRTKSWWVMIILFSGVLLMSTQVAVIFFGFVSFLALKEYLSIIPTRRADRIILLWAYLAIIVQFYWVYIAWYGMFIVFIPVYMFLFLPAIMTLHGQTKGFLGASGTLHWGLMICVFSISHAAYLLVMPNDWQTGAGLLLFLVILTELNDIAQYCWGKSLGRFKILPSVSPNKTWEGFLGGVATTIGASVLLAPILTPFSMFHALSVGIIIGVTGFLGDITVSALKRDLDIKDTSGFIPGHGGVLDRLDSLTFTAPIFFHFTRYFYSDLLGWPS